MTLNQFFSALGAPVILPVFIFLFAVALRVKARDAFRSALLIGIALVGINMVVGFFTTQITPSVNDMVKNSGVNLPYLDVGWGAAAAIAYASRVGLLVIPLAIGINLLALALRLTDTLNLDVWNFWHYAFAGSLTAAFTGSLWLGFLAAVVAELFSLFFADWMQPAARQYYGYEGVSFTTISSVEYIPFAIAVNWVLDRLGLGKVKLDPETIKKRMRVFGEPAFIGLVIGLLIGILAYWKSLNTFQSWVTILTDGIVVAAVMHIFPLMPQILMSGLVPISKSVREMFSKRGGRTIHFGMDTALCVGEAATLSTALLLIPIAIVLMVVLPFNRFLWIADLVSFPWFIALVTPITHGNILKNTIIGALYLILGNLIITNITPLFTKAAVEAGWQVAAGTAGIGAGSEGISWFHWVIFHAMAHPLSIVAVFLVYALVVWRFKARRAAWYRACGYVEKAEGTAEAR
ncbi:MAG TPA: PTS sugar transporter subunit IIC [Firmicutes bacterium]|nr:PTS sugar transporter subunit IIC [Bacillota bacterium]